MLQERNDRGIQLIERNEETAIFYEKLNVQDSMLRKGLKLYSQEYEILCRSTTFIRVLFYNLTNNLHLYQKANWIPLSLSRNNYILSFICSTGLIS